jgi:hypothetical protein
MDNEECMRRIVMTSLMRMLLSLCEIKVLIIDDDTGVGLTNGSKS